MLREMLRLRLVSGLGADLDKVDFPTVWNELCVSHYHGEDTSTFGTVWPLLRRRRNSALQHFGVLVPRSAQSGSN